ncbi:hypothetical protein [Arthrobacter sp. ERGS1:01]|nr:hypothetical protein [Arthrobacter sp. ERGS1:01]
MNAFKAAARLAVDQRVDGTSAAKGGGWSFGGSAGQMVAPS